MKYLIIGALALSIAFPTISIAEETGRETSYADECILLKLKIDELKKNGLKMIKVPNHLDESIGSESEIPNEEISKFGIPYENEQIIIRKKLKQSEIAERIYHAQLKVLEDLYGEHERDCDGYAFKEFSDDIEKRLNEAARHATW